MLVEVCANSFESARNAQAAGADRIELCSELGVGGITPSYGLLKQIREHISIPVHVLIRPRSGDFTYSEVEFEIMKNNVKLCVDLGFEGIVSGVLHTDFSLDIKRTEALKALAGNLKFTFHRAFDWVTDPERTLEQLDAMQVDYILSSGQRTSAWEGISLLSQLNDIATHCTLMPGGGVNADNIKKFRESGFRAIHLSGSRYEPRLQDEPYVSMNSPSFLRDSGVFVSNIEAISAVVQEVK